MKNVVLAMGVVAFLASLLYFGNTEKGAVAAGGDTVPPTIVSIDPGTPPESIDLDTLIYQDYPATTTEQKVALGIGSVDLGTVVQSVVIDLEAECRIFSVTLKYKPEATAHNDVIIQTSSTVDFAEFVNLPNSPANVLNGEWFKAENNQMGRYIRCLSNNASSNKSNDYEKIAISRK